MTFLMLWYNYCCYPWIFKCTVFQKNLKKGNTHHYFFIFLLRRQIEVIYFPEKKKIVWIVERYARWINLSNINMNSVCLISNNMIFSFKLIFDKFFKYLCFLGFYERWSNKFIKYRSSMLSFFQSFFPFRKYKNAGFVSPLTTLSHWGRPHL